MKSEDVVKQLLEHSKDENHTQHCMACAFGKFYQDWIKVHPDPQHYEAGKFIKICLALAALQSMEAGVAQAKKELGKENITLKVGVNFLTAAMLTNIMVKYELEARTTIMDILNDYMYPDKSNQDQFIQDILDALVRSAPNFKGLK